MPSSEDDNVSAPQEASDSELFELILQADEEALSEGLSPKQRGMATVSKVMK